MNAEVIDCEEAEQAFSYDEVRDCVTAAVEHAQWGRDRRQFALEKALVFFFGEEGPTTDNPMDVARAAATFDRFLKDGSVADGKPEAV